MGRKNGDLSRRCPPDKPAGLSCQSKRHYGKSELVACGGEHDTENSEARRPISSFPRQADHCGSSMVADQSQPTPSHPNLKTVYSEMSVQVDDSPSPILFDSLPYYDNDFERDPSLKEKAEKLIAREGKPSTPQTLHPRVPPPITLFSVRAHCSVLAHLLVSDSQNRNTLF